MINKIIEEVSKNYNDIKKVEEILFVNNSLDDEQLSFLKDEFKKRTKRSDYEFLPNIDRAKESERIISYKKIINSISKKLKTTTKPQLLTLRQKIILIGYLMDEGLFPSLFNSQDHSDNDHYSFLSYLIGESQNYKQHKSYFNIKGELKRQKTEAKKKQLIYDLKKVNKAFENLKDHPQIKSIYDEISDVIGK